MFMFVSIFHDDSSSLQFYLTFTTGVAAGFLIKNCIYVNYGNYSTVQKTEIFEGFFGGQSSFRLDESGIK